MSTEAAPDNSQFTHKKEAYKVTVEHSAPHGNTLFRRDVGIGAKAVRRLRTKTTESFLKEFERVPRG